LASILRAACIASRVAVDVQVLNAPTGASYEAVIDVAAEDPEAVGRIANVVGREDTGWKHGIVPGQFRIHAVLGRCMVVVWAPVETEEAGQ